MTKILLFCTSVLVLAGYVRSKPDYIFNGVVDGWLKLHRIPATWQEAFLRCHYEGAVLASPLNDQLLSSLHEIMVESKLENHKIFLGTNALHSKGDFFSVEGVPLADMTMTWGDKNFGADGDGDCLTMHIDGYTNYMSVSLCTERHPYVCYKKQETETSLEPCGTFDKKYVLNQHTGNCYKLHKEHQNWWRANMICAAEGGYLAILNNEQEASIVTEIFSSGSSGVPDIWERMHIGVRAWDDDAWMTIHGDSLENMFNSWTTQPAGQRLCGSLLGDGTLGKEECESAAIFVCEKHPNTTRYADKTWDNKAVVRVANMSEEMQQDAIYYATKALEKYTNDKDIAKYIKDRFDEKYHPNWLCVVGHSFNSYVNYISSNYIFFYLGQMSILLFKN